MKPKIAVHLITAANAYQIQSQEDALSTARRLDVDVILQFADADATRQIHQICEQVYCDPARRPQALIVEAVRDGGMERVVKNAARAGVGIVLIHGDGQFIDAVRKEFPDVLLSWVTADNEEIGRIQARQFRAFLPRGGLVLYVTGPSTSSTSQRRLDGAREALKGSNIELSIVAGSDWTSATGEKIVSDWLRLVVPGGVTPALVGCQCDDFAVAAGKSLRETAQAFEKPALARVLVTGVDGVPSFGQRLVAENELAATVIMPVATGPAIELVAKALREQKPPPSRLLLPPLSCPEIDTLRPLTDSSGQRVNP
ncbi:MAG: sugar ABC transporter substrate-binding protein [Vicinamibacteria bacterium]|nr:sugar ABC transporter substrate-binding protein [Vicinamibacteria bacterium]